MARRAHGWERAARQPARASPGRGPAVGKSGQTAPRVGRRPAKEGGSRPISRVLSWATIHLGRTSPCASSDLPGSPCGPQERARWPARFPIWSCSRWGLPCRRMLPPARCALTAPFHPYRPARASNAAVDMAVCFLLHFPWARAPQALPGTLPCGARTFLRVARRSDCLADSRARLYRDSAIRLELVERGGERSSFSTPPNRYPPIRFRQHQRALVESLRPRPVNCAAIRAACDTGNSCSSTCSTRSVLAVALRRRHRPHSARAPRDDDHEFAAGHVGVGLAARARVVCQRAAIGAFEALGQLAARSRRASPPKTAARSRNVSTSRCGAS